VFVKFVYWLAVLVISLALVVGLVLFFESRDQSAIDEGGAQIESV
jgi:cytochrome b subunit of formate dehydrogenase